MKKINAIFFILLPFIDILTSLSTRFIDLPVSIGMITKSLYLLIVTIYIFFYSKSKRKSTYIKYFILVAVYSCIYFLTKTDLLSTSFIFNEVSSLFKVFYGSLLFFAFIVLYDDLKYNNDNILKLMIYSLLTYVLLLIIPTITHTNFNSYEGKNNEGSVGWFYAANDISSILLILYPFIYIFLNKVVNDKNKKTYLYYLLLIPIIYAFFIIGTKTSWLGIVIITCILLIIYTIKKEDKKTIISLILVFITTCILTLISPTLTNMHKDSERANNNTPRVSNTVQKIESSKTTEKVCKSKKITEIMDKSIYKKIHVLLSGRENKAYTLFLLYKDSRFIDKFFGIGFSETKRINDCYVEKYIEIDILDIFMHYGIIGLIVCLMPLIYVIKLIIDKKVSYNTNNLIYLFIALLLLGISCIAGHVLGYPTVNVYYVLVLLLITKEYRKTKRRGKIL